MVRNTASSSCAQFSRLTLSPLPSRPSPQDLQCVLPSLPRFILSRAELPTSSTSSIFRMPVSSLRVFFSVRLVSTRRSFFVLNLSQILDGYAANTRIAASPLAGRPIIVALSANTDDDTRDLVAKEGFFFYLTKPMASRVVDQLFLPPTFEAETIFSSSSLQVIGVLARVLVEAHTTRVRNQSEGTGSPGNRVPSPSKKIRLDPEPRSTTNQPTRGGKEVRIA